MNRCFALRSTCCVCAISFRISWMTTRSYAPTSLFTRDARHAPSSRTGKGEAHDTPRGNLNVVVALHDVHVQLALRRCEEHPLVDLELFRHTQSSSVHAAATTKLLRCVPSRRPSRTARAACPLSASSSPRPRGRRIACAESLPTPPARMMSQHSTAVNRQRRDRLTRAFRRAESPWW